MSRTLALIAALATALSVAACGGQAAPPSDTASTSAAAASTSSLPTLTRTTAPQAETTTEAAPAQSITAVDPATFDDGGGIAWESPSGNIACRIRWGEYSSGCQSGDVPIPAGADCVTPSFTIDQLGKGFYLHPDRVEPTCFNQGTFYSPTPKPLPYNHSISKDGYTCTSRESGMSCTTGGGHGFEMSKEVARSY